ncbi:MAG: AAA family ATPase, partial [Elusimicrobia bacterium]|nr:AAA family ATPase [Elusimicrobiota bacterium]
DIEQVKALAAKEAAERKIEGISQGMAEVNARRNALLETLDREKAWLAQGHEELKALELALDKLEKRKFFLISQKDFIEKMEVQDRDAAVAGTEFRFLSPVAPVAGQGGLIGRIKQVVALEGARIDEARRQFPGSTAETFYEIICESKYIDLDPQSLASQIEGIERESADLLSRREVKTAEINDRSQIMARVQVDIHAEDKRLFAFEAQKGDAGLEVQKVSEELESVLFEIRDAEQGIARLKGDEENLSGELVLVEKQIIFAQDGIKRHQETMAAKRHEREEAAVACAQIEAEIASLEERERSWRENQEAFRQDLNGHLEEVTSLDGEVAGFAGRREALHAEIATLTQAIEDARHAQEGQREALARYQTEEEDLSQRLNSVRTQIMMIEKEIADHRETVHARAMKAQEIAFHEQSIRDRMMERYQLDLSAVAGPVAVAEGLPVPEGEGAAEPPVDIEALKAEIDRLVKRCESFGGVNLMAIEEFEELKNRFEFLTKQQSDLLTAKDSLEQTIRKINRTTRELFIETFTKVNDQFRSYFRLLFNGGEAQLVLLDPENALESGIEIVARPPGKKLQTISLLSGGEKTMTAIALIFSVFKVNPSPFCVLDEIDAALDEANVDRFAKVLKEFAQIAQFIVITHNKKTIANANVMYGVTMQQTGVSRVVSVKLSEHKPVADAPIPPPVGDGEPSPQPAPASPAPEEHFAQV